MTLAAWPVPTSYKPKFTRGRSTHEQSEPSGEWRGRLEGSRRISEASARPSYPMSIPGYPSPRQPGSLNKDRISLACFVPGSPTANHHLSVSVLKSSRPIYNPSTRYQEPPLRFALALQLKGPLLAPVYLCNAYTIRLPLQTHV
jgi:hypothetical protein